jgi:hypothetical protein
MNLPNSNMFRRFRAIAHLFPFVHFAKNPPNTRRDAAAERPGVQVTNLIGWRLAYPFQAAVSTSILNYEF